MKKFSLISTLAILLAPPVFAQSIDLSVDGQFAGTATLTSSSNTWELAQPATFEGAVIKNGTLPDGQTGLLTFDPDPAFNFGFAITNTSGSTGTYTITFPLVYNSFGFPTGSQPLSVSLSSGTYTVSASLAVTLSQSDGNGATFSVAPGNTNLMEGLFDSTDEIAIGTGSLTLPSGTVGTTSTSETFTPVSMNEYISATGSDTMSTTVSFVLSEGDSASFTGAYSITAVPEPSSIALGLLAVVGFGVLLRRCGKVRP